MDNETEQNSVAPAFQKLWGWFYLLTILLLSLPFYLWYEFAVYFLTHTNLSTSDVMVATALPIGMMLIVVALVAQMVENYTAQIDAHGVSKKVWGKSVKINWEEVEDVKWEGGITLISKNKSLHINPGIFKKSKDVYEFVDEQWRTVKMRSEGNDVKGQV